jgi:hypothetical protein
MSKSFLYLKVVIGGLEELFPVFFEKISAENSGAFFGDFLRN